METNAFVKNVNELFGNSLNTEHVQEFMQHTTPEYLGIVLEGIKVAFGKIESFEIEFSLLGSQFLTDSNVALTLNCEKYSVQVCYIDEEILNELPRLSAEGYNIGDLYLAVYITSCVGDFIQITKSCSKDTKVGFYNINKKTISFC